MTSQMKTELISALEKLLGAGGVLTGTDVTSRIAGVLNGDGLKAFAIARPRTTEEVSEILKLCTAAKQPVVTLGGKTGLVHGGEASPDELIISMERMNAIEAIDPVGRTITAQAGVVLENIQQKARDLNLYYGVDYGSRGSATIGGGIATNAGGNRVIRYGMTRASVLGIEAVLANGTIISSMNSMMKNNSGYDLKQLFIGSEGTLGIVTRAVLRLHEMPVSQCTALVACEDFESVTRLLKVMDSRLGGQLAAFEVMWRDYFDLVTGPTASEKSPFEAKYPFYVLIESLGANDESDAAQFASALESAMEAGFVVDATIAQSIQQREGLWRIRDGVEHMFKHHPVHNFDVSLPISEMKAYTENIEREVASRWPEAHCWIFGHMGDGNLHVSIAPKADVAHEVESLVYEPLRAFKGAVSAEHGIGLEKKEWLNVSRSPEELALMRLLKSTLDPLDLLNAGKVI